MIPGHPSTGFACPSPFRLVTGLAVAVLLVGCGSTDADPTDEGPGLVATTTVWADIVSNVACGAPVRSLVPAGADPHSYEASLRDRELVGDASLLVANGAGLEATLDDLVAEATDAEVLTVTDHVELIEHDDAADHGDEDTDEHGDETTGDEHADETSDETSDEHGHSEGDPHVWQDPNRVIAVLDEIATALTAVGVDTCEAGYRDELVALDAELEATFATIPPERRLLVTGHDALAYLAERYGFEVIGTVIPASTTLAEANPAGLAELTDLIDERGVTAVFVDTFDPASDAEALAERIGIPAVPLTDGSLTDDAGTYVDMMRANATAITGALAP